MEVKSTDGEDGSTKPNSSIEIGALESKQIKKHDSVKKRLSFNFGKSKKSVSDPNAGKIVVESSDSTSGSVSMEPVITESSSKKAKSEKKMSKDKKKEKSKPIEKQLFVTVATEEEKTPRDFKESLESLNSETLETKKSSTSSPTSSDDMSSKKTPLPRRSMRASAMTSKEEIIVEDEREHFDANDANEDDDTSLFVNEDVPVRTELKRRFSSPEVNEIPVRITFGDRKSSWRSDSTRSLPTLSEVNATRDTDRELMDSKVTTISQPKAFFDVILQMAENQIEEQKERKRMMELLLELTGTTNIVKDSLFAPPPDISSSSTTQKNSVNRELRVPNDDTDDEDGEKMIYYVKKLEKYKTKCADQSKTIETLTAELKTQISQVERIQYNYFKQSDEKRRDYENELLLLRQTNLALQRECDNLSNDLQELSKHAVLQAQEDYNSNMNLQAARVLQKMQESKIMDGGTKNAGSLVLSNQNESKKLNFSNGGLDSRQRQHLEQSIKSVKMNNNHLATKMVGGNFRKRDRSKKEDSNEANDVFQCFTSEKG